MSTLRCRLLGHAAMSTHYRSGEAEFALCMRCGDDLTRATGAEEWSEVPQGYRVTWARQASDTSAAAVAERMRLAPAPRRHRPRSDGVAETGQRRARPRRADLTLILGLTGRFVMDSVFERLRRPARPEPGFPQLPAPGQLTAASRSRGRSRRG
jgi:hypothetical protein